MKGINEVVIVLARDVDNLKKRVKNLEDKQVQLPFQQERKSK